MTIKYYSVKETFNEKKKTQCIEKIAAKFATIIRIIPDKSSRPAVK